MTDLDRAMAALEAAHRRIDSLAGELADERKTTVHLREALVRRGMPLPFNLPPGGDVTG